MHRAGVPQGRARRPAVGQSFDAACGVGIVLKRAAEAGLSGSAFESLSPHGLRAGFITDAFRAGARDVQIMNHSRHKDASTMYGYMSNSLEH